MVSYICLSVNAILLKQGKLTKPMNGILKRDGSETQPVMVTNVTDIST